MKSKILISFLIVLILSISMASAITINETTSIDCTGKLTYDDKVLLVSDSYQGNFPVYVQSTVGFPENNLHWIDEQCNSISSNTWAHGTLSLIGATTDKSNGDIYIRTISGSVITIYVLDNTFTFKDSWVQIDSSTTGDITIVNDYVYIQGGDGDSDYYSKNGIWIGKINLTNDISCIGTFNSMFDAGEDTLGLLCSTSPTTGIVYEVSEDLQTLISSVAVGNIESLHANIENNIIIAQTSSTLIRTFQFNDVLIGSFLANYSQTFCVNDISLCYDTVHNLNPDSSIDSYCNGLYTDCPVEGLQGGCENNLVNEILIGSCQAVSCESQCDFNNQITCTSINTYTQCGNYDADVCLETGSNLFCPANQICTTNENGVSGCEETILPTNLLPQMSIQKTIKSTNAYEINIVDNTYYIASVFETAQLGFNIIGTPTPTYSSRIQNYEETTSVYDYLTTPTTQWEGTIPPITTDVNNRLKLELNSPNSMKRNIPSTFGNKKVIYDFTPKDITKDGEIYIQVNDENDNQIDELYFEYDKDLFNMIVSRSNEGIITENIFIDDGSSSNLYSIHVEITINEQINTLYYFITIFRTINNEEIPFRYFTIPYSYADVGSSQISNIEFQSNKEKWDIFGVEVLEIPNFNSYKSIDVNNELQENFEFLFTGCYKNRIYGNQYSIPTYHFYDEVEICVTKISGQVDVELDEEALIEELNFVESIFGRKFTSNEKVLIAVLTISLVMGMFIMLYRETHDSILLGAGVLISGLFTFYFALIGYIPTWIIIVIGVVAVAVGVKTTTSTFTRYLKK